MMTNSCGLITENILYIYFGDQAFISFLKWVVADECVYLQFGIINLE